MICPKCGKNVSPNTKMCSCGHKFSLGGNSEFFEKADSENLSTGSVFADMFKKHTMKDLHEVFNAGLVKESKNPKDMLRNWQKPWVFVFAFIIMVAVSLGCVLAGKHINTHMYVFAAMFGVNIIPVTICMLMYELNIPKNISFYEVLLIILISGVFSVLLITIPSVFIKNPHAGFAAFTEEPAKLALILFFMRKADKKYILNGLLVGVAVGVGFTFFEATCYALKIYGDSSTAYTSAQALDAFTKTAKSQLIFRNAGEFFSGHLLYSGLVGAAIAAIKRDKPMSFGALFHPYTLFWLCIAMIAHYTWNSAGVLYKLATGNSMSTTAFVFQFIIYSVIGLILIFFHAKKGIKQITDTVYANRIKVNHRATPDFYDIDISPKNEYVKQERVGNVPKSDDYFPSSISIYGLDGAFRGQRIKVGYGEIVNIGTNSDCKVKFGPDTPGISHEHCSVLYNGDILITDLSSSYGTFAADGTRFKPYEATKVHDGSAFYLAEKKNMFRIGR